jgi:hypothetical protein
VSCDIGSFTEIKTGTQTESSNYEDDSFESAKALNIAIKHNPSHYNGKVVSVTGTIAKTDSEMLLGSSSYWSGISRTEIRYKVKSNPNFRIVMSDEIQQSVLETGDKVEICGTVTISDGEIYLDNCEYTMIETFEEIVGRLE